MPTEMAGTERGTFWNAVSRVLGLYSGNISADTLTVGCRRNIKPEMAEVKGKRLLIAAEMQEGARLNDSTVKQLCSTDDVFAEKKYKDPFSFKPCHTLVLYTNHLPRVSASDDGYLAQAHRHPVQCQDYRQERHQELRRVPL